MDASTSAVLKLQWSTRVTLVSLASPTTQVLPLVLSLFLLGISVLFLIGAYVAPETRGNLK